MGFGQGSDVDVLVALQVALAWVVGLFLLHRLNVRRLRAQARLVALRRLDWEALVSGLLPPSEGPQIRELPPTLPDGSSTPDCLRSKPVPSARARHAVLVGLVTGVPFKDPERIFTDTGFSGGEIRWLCTLVRMRTDPLGALEELQSRAPDSASELYLREYLTLVHRTHLLNLELQVLASRQRLAQGLVRYGDAPALHFVRALAASLVGWNHAATNDLARAVYFSGTSSFYLRAVLDTPWLEEARPELVLQCRKAWDMRLASERSPTVIEESRVGESLPKSITRA